MFGDGAGPAALRARARALGLGERVRFPGHVPAREALAQLAVFVLSSHMESAPLALLEAMTAGVPVVATRVGGVPELVPDGAGLLVAPGDPEALAAAIASLLDDPARASAQAAAARRHVEAEGGAAGMTERTLALYEGGPAVKVLLATPGTDVGGAERIVIALAHALPERGHEVALWGPPGALEPELDGAPSSASSSRPRADGGRGGRGV